MCSRSIHNDYNWVYMLTSTVVTCKIKHLQNICKNVLEPRKTVLKHLCKCFILHVTTPTTVLQLRQCPFSTVCTRIYDLRICRINDDILRWVEAGSDNCFPKSRVTNCPCDTDQVKLAICPVNVPWRPVVRYAVYLRITHIALIS